MSPSPIHENKWKELVQTGKFTFQSMTSVHDPLPMVQKLLDEEREAVKSALHAVDEHTRIKRRELAEAHRRWMNENKPANDGGSTKRAKPKSRNGHRRRLEQYEQYLHYSEKKRSVYLDVICEEDDEQQQQQHPQRCSTSHSRREKPPIRLSSKNEDLALEEREAPVLPPIDPNWRQRESIGKHEKAKLNNWQTVADNFIDSDARKRTRLRISGKTNQTQLHLSYHNSDGNKSERKGTDNEFRLQKKRQYHNGPVHSSSNSRWISNIPSLAPSPDD